MADITRILLAENEIAEALASLPHWYVEGDGLGAEFHFKNFSEAFGFMTRVAMLAEKLDHHPEWSNSYNRVTIRLTTHSSKGITGLDVEMARRISVFV